ncbi:NAD(P)H-dependent oxidoreductase [Fulvivirgaceae bacterium BMA12]|uniref:FMN dependent NADH:quinone oxidoreductase n=1 Tax=Agaribacillus aureus TaxID=3051825 RepID=A0ABT8LFP0_9BACT|nr:NAD(P)H-dependent oxidoreductase [Fulvivirgaceae bacterium BMA12]
MKVLKINASASRQTSLSRVEVDRVISKLLVKYPSAEIIDRDVAYSNLPFPNDKFVEAIFHKGPLNEEQRLLTKVSDQLVDELLESEILVIGAPMYNFTIPASLKAYFDLVARAGKTYQYNEQGYPLGLVEGKKAIIVITTGGVPLGSPMDFSKQYITAFLGFLGIKNLTFIELDENRFKYEEKRKKATEKLASILD